MVEIGKKKYYEIQRKKEEIYLCNKSEKVGGITKGNKIVSLYYFPFFFLILYCYVL